MPVVLRWFMMIWRGVEVGLAILGSPTERLVLVRPMTLAQRAGLAVAAKTRSESRSPNREYFVGGSRLRDGTEGSRPRSGVSTPVYHLMTVVLCR